MKYLKPYNESFKKSSMINSDDLKIDKLKETDAVYDMTKEQYDSYFWDCIDLYSIALSLKKNYVKDFDISYLSEQRLKDYYVGSYGTGELEDAVEFDEYFDGNVFNYIDEEIGWDSPLLYEYFDCDDELFDIWFEEKIIDKIGEQEIIDEYGEPWNKKENKLDVFIYQYYYEEYFLIDSYFHILLNNDEIDIDVEKEFNEYLKQKNIKRFNI